MKDSDMLKPGQTAYIAGPMSSYPLFNFPAFDEAADALRAKGFVVISPADLDRLAGFDPAVNPHAEFKMDEAVRRDVEGILQADAVVMLPGWEKSVGAQAEKAVALWAKKPVLIYPDLTLWDQEPDILEEAFRLTSGDRQNSYGPPDQDFARTAQMWAAILGCKVEATDVALCMIALKLSRCTWSSKRDSVVDIAGYARCLWLCMEAKKAREAQKEPHVQ